jgi:hypothetical protein
MIIGRFILRFFLVPLGGVAAAMIAAFVVCFAHWTQFTKMVAEYPQSPENFVIAALLIGPMVVLGMSVAAFAMLMPAAVGVLISEAFAIRSWMFHATNGALASWIGWVAMEKVLKDFEFYSEPKIVVAAGIAAGFTYWAVAGWSAGFWKPVFSRLPQPPTVAAA